jgi:hypothetical protein
VSAKERRLLKKGATSASDATVGDASTVNKANDVADDMTSSTSQQQPAAKVSFANSMFK